jgi:hypothetical protein
MGIFSEFHKKRFVENADVFPANRERNSENGIEREVKNTFISPARNPHSPHFGVVGAKSAENVENTPPQNVNTRPHAQESTSKLGGWQFPNHLPPLPDVCPLVTGGSCPTGCRYTTKFLVRLIKTGALPDPQIGCQLRSVCGLFSEWPRTRPELPALEDIPPALEPEVEEIRCESCPAWDVERSRCYGLSYFEHRSGPWYSGQEALGRCPRKEYQLKLLPESSELKNESSGTPAGAQVQDNGG